MDNVLQDCAPGSEERQENSEGTRNDFSESHYPPHPGDILLADVSAAAYATVRSVSHCESFLNDVPAIYLHHQQLANGINQDYAGKRDAVDEHLQPSEVNHDEVYKYFSRQASFHNEMNAFGSPSNFSLLRIEVDLFYDQCDQRGNAISTLVSMNQYPPQKQEVSDGNKGNRSGNVHGCGGPNESKGMNESTRRRSNSVLNGNAMHVGNGAVGAGTSQHLSPIKKSNEIRCPDCRKTFSRKDLLKRHRLSNGTCERAREYRYLQQNLQQQL